jgi:hypothetical protein
VTFVSVQKNFYRQVQQDQNFSTSLINSSLLAHLSWKLKWANLIARHPSVHPSVCKLLHFRLLLQNHWANFNLT